MNWMFTCIQHETLHSLGIAHIQSRFDRDLNVTLETNNIDPQEYYNFEKVDPTKYSTYGVSYEGQSMMHYTCEVLEMLRIRKIFSDYDIGATYIA